MTQDDIPASFVNKGAMLRLINESRYYRTGRTIYMLLALIGWGAFAFLLFKG